MSGNQVIVNGSSEEPLPRHDGASAPEDRVDDELLDDTHEVGGPLNNPWLNEDGRLVFAPEEEA